MLVGGFRVYGGFNAVVLKISKGVEEGNFGGRDLKGKLDCWVEIIEEELEFF